MLWKPAGATPTTVKHVPGESDCLAHNRGIGVEAALPETAPSTTTGSLSSLLAKPRPRTMGSSVTSKKFALAAWPHTRSGSPLPPIEAGISS